MSAPEPSSIGLWTAIVTAIVSIIGTIGLWIYNWKREGRQHTWTKEEAAIVADTLAEKVKLVAAELEEKRRADAEVLADKQRGDQAAVSVKLMERAEQTAARVAEAAALLTTKFDDIQKAAGAAFEVGNHSKAELSGLTAELIELRGEMKLIKRQINGVEVVPTLETLSRQVNQLSKFLKQGRGKR